MEVGGRIKQLRAREGLSQDDLAQRVYVSRQTVSSWENDKTYPDVQSLLILSNVFGTTVDELIKGDVEVMEKSIDKDVRTISCLCWVMVVFLLLMLAALVWFTLQLTVWNWEAAHTVPTFVLALVMWGVAMTAATWVERIKKERDLVTRQEILAFMHGEPVDRTTEKSRRERLIPRWMKIIRTVGTVLIAAAVGAFLGWHVGALIDNAFHVL